tara:strand:- start:2526 stop:2651 length:126 start_codon:yes stop_codon:yes gene_type:complete
MVSALWPLLAAMNLTAEFWFATASLALIGALVVVARLVAHR